MDAAVLQDPTQWLKAGEAAAILGVSTQTVKRLRYRGLVSIKQLPGCQPLVSRADVERIAAEAVVPAGSA